jgi:hypothetical protein
MQALTTSCSCSDTEFHSSTACNHNITGIAQRLTISNKLIDNFPKAMNKHLNFLLCNSGVADPNWFPDPDKAFQVNADPDPDPGF